MRRSAEDAARTREALLWASLDAFREDGWDGATFEKIAERAGVTRGAVHHYFRSKRILLTEALRWGWQRYESHIFPEGHSDPADYLNHLLHDFVVLLDGDVRFRSLVSVSVLVAPRVLVDTETEPKEKALKGWGDRVAHDLEQSSQVVERPDLVAGLVIVLLQGLTVTAVTSPAALPSQEDLDVSVAALVRGLLACPPGSL